MNTYQILDMAGKKHSVEGTDLDLQDGIAVIMSGEDIVALFRTPFSVVCEGPIVVH